MGEEEIFAWAGPQSAIAIVNLKSRSNSFSSDSGNFSHSHPGSSPLSNLTAPSLACASVRVRSGQVLFVLFLQALDIFFSSNSLSFGYFRRTPGTLCWLTENFNCKNQFDRDGFILQISSVVGCW
jgi:hypothetical protein